MYFTEIAASLYAWDLADEGIVRCLDNLQEHADVNSAYLVAAMHNEKRPLHQRHFPHNPVRKYYTPEDSRVYFKTHDEFYENTRLRPYHSERDFLKNTDWLDVLIEEARKRGMKTGAELSHTIFPAEPLANEFPDTLQRNIYGQIISNHLMCMNNSDARNYTVGLFADVVTNHDIDFIQTCLILFNTGRVWDPHVSWYFAPDLAARKRRGELHRLVGLAQSGGCFCEACQAKARAEGLDVEKIMIRIRELADIAGGRTLERAHVAALINASNTSASDLLMEYPELFEWMQFRARSITGLFKEISEKVKAIKPQIDFRYNTYMPYPELAGLHLPSIVPYIDSLRESDYSEQVGTLEALELKRQLLYKERRVLGYDKPLIAALGVRPMATPEILKASIAICGETGCDGLSLGHYDGATMERLRAIKEGMAEAEIELVSSK